MTEQVGLTDRFLIDSAGIHGYHVGEPPDRRSAQTAAERGYSLEGQSARKVVMEDFDRFDLILGMDHGHGRSLESMQPEGSRAVIRPFLYYAPDCGRDGVPDPYYGGQDGFALVLDLIEQGCEGILLRHKP